jgi:hypothetical protein
VSSSRPAIAVLVVCVLATASARADEPHRAVPDYDGRASVAPDAVDALLWVPRVLTSPLYFLSEYVIRIPLGAFDTWVERNEVAQLLFDFFRFGPEKELTIVPTAFYDFGFLPSVGIYARWNDMGAVGHRLSAHAATWGEDWVSFTLNDSFRLDSLFTFFARAHYIRRQDYLLGIEDGENGGRVITRYSGERVDGEAGYKLRFGPRSTLTVSGLVQGSTFGTTSFGAPDQPSVIAYVASHGGPRPIGFAEGYGLASARAHAIVDTREPNGLPSSGVRLEARAELAGTFAGLSGSRWVRLDGEALAASDFLGGRRAMSLAVDVAMILPLDASPVPFDQGIDLGGAGPLMAFSPGQLRGLSALSATLAYEWPVWVFVNAQLFAAVGGVFGERYEGLALGRMRLSFGLAMRPNDPGDQPFEVGLAFGTGPFADGAGVDTVRFFVGARNLL